MQNNLWAFWAQRNGRAAGLVGVLAMLPLACVAGDADSLVCIDWKADGIDSCNPPGEDDEGGDTDGPEQVPNVCALVGAATGRELDLGGYTIASEPWTGDPESTFSWDASFPPQWSVSGAPGTNTPSALASVPNLDGGHTLTVSNTATRVGDLLWIQADGAAWAELTMEPDAWPATAVELSDGSTIWWAPSVDDGGAGLLSWNFGGPAPFTVRGRENTLERVALAGPSAGATSPTIDGEEPGGGRAWLPVSANCRIVAGTDETGAPPAPGTGSGGGEDPEPDPPGACDLVEEALGLPPGTLGWPEPVPGVFLRSPEPRYDERLGVMQWDDLSGWTWADLDAFDTAVLDLGQADLGVQGGCGADVEHQEAHYIQLDLLDGDVAYHANLFNAGEPVTNKLGIPIDYVIPANTMLLSDGSTLAAVMVPECIIDGRWEITGSALVVGYHSEPAPGLTPWRAAGPLTPVADMRPTVDDSEDTPADVDAFVPVMGDCIRLADYGQTDPDPSSEPLDESGD